MRKLILFLTLAVMTATNLRADEGMWLMHMLKKINEAEMQNMGLNLSAEDIYSINQASLKDAIVRLNGGMCTAEVISNQGLVLTNHHCAYGAIQSFSSPENDILTNGFWAFSKDQEKPIKDFEVGFLVRIEDATAAALKGVTAQMSEAERNAIIEANIAAIQAAAIEGTKFTAEVKSFFHGNEYYTFVYNTFKDVRLVGTAQESIGKFGGDTDNWMWPRHTGDFALLRIYADQDNNPATYAATNKPFIPKRHLKVSLDGVKNEDFTMVMGYPGSTDRFLSSHGVEQAINLYNPSVVEVRDLKLKTMKKFMDADPKVRIQYASKYASTANYWKYYIGQTKGLKRLNVYQKKKSLEDEFAAWVKNDRERQAIYGDALNLISAYYQETTPTVKSSVYAREAGLVGSDIVLFAFRFARTFEAAMGQEDAEKQKAILNNYLGAADKFFKDYDQATDKAVLTAMLTIYRQNISREFLPSVYTTIQSKFKGSIERYVDDLYKRSFMVDPLRLKAFIAKPTQKAFDKDPAIALGKSMYDAYSASFASPSQDKYDRGYRLLVDGLRTMKSNTNFAPDANSTMRLTYGTVGDYYPADGVHYDYITTAKGIMEKYDPTDPEFQAPQELLDLITRKDYGRWANENNDLPICFISNNDITGGNSGSPVINGNGDLIGLAFDGNWEAMSGDIAFETELQRTISVDIRYVMFIIDKLAGAKNIIDEIDFVKSTPRPAVVDPVKVETPQEPVTPSRPTKK
jgi:hypothetical protein